VPAGRFPSAGEFAGALAQCSAAAPTSAAQQRLLATPTLRGRRLAGLGLALLTFLAATALLIRDRTANSPRPAAPKMLAVLPFKNLGAPGDQYFADGLTEEITSRLGSVASLGVISRTSADRYRSTTRPLREIGRELGVGYILEGSVRWERRPDGTSRVRVTPQLIQVAEDRHLWADRYEGDLRDVFQVQSGIAEQVTNALGVALAATERQALAVQPTANLSAYDAYLRGNALYPSDWRIGMDQLVAGLQRAAEQYREAIRLDSTFALAYAKLGRTTVDLYSLSITDSSTAAHAKGAIDRALALAPGLSEAHVARGRYHLEIDRDSTGALRELATALASRPNDAELLMEVAPVEWLARGPNSQAIPRAERAVQLDPRTPARLLGLADLYRLAQRFDDAERLYDRMITLEPQSPSPYVGKAAIHLLRDGDPASARAIIRQAAQQVDSTSLITAAATRLSTWFALGILDESYQQALLKLPPEAFGRDTAWYGLAKGYTYRARGDSVRSRAYYDTAFANATAGLQKTPSEPWFHIVRAWVLASRGRKTEAYTTMAQALASTGLQHWVKRGEPQARLAVFAGDSNRALEVLERGNWGPDLTIPWLKADPFWDPLRRNPRFERLLERRK
jgi:serine/threonine-protein kinase